MRIAHVICVMAAVSLPAAISAQEKKQGNDSTLSEAGKIAARPAHDVGIANKKVPPVLQRAAAAPYSLQGTASCGQLSSGIASLNSALGPDFGEKAAVSGSKAGQIAKIAGETVVDTIIPFRGLVREVSGAAAAQRRMQAATYAGLARRGFLRGVARGKGCRI
ncbi:hypothetical protein ACM61V_14245 [Sphingomonas sp. TX0543]|uniref:hypothetical protein n=1 Tax=unclassified Sphingomonas TaxID=196159 RepID=UPI002015FEF4|nr:hypothetical protein [Sphingomonas sp. 3P27F8]